MGEDSRRAKILGAAFAEFSERGYDGATIKRIAGRAGVRSPALIYWYFSSKEELFWEVLEAYAPPLRAVAERERLMGLPPEEALLELGRAYLSFGGENAGMMRLLIGEALRRSEVSEEFVRRGPRRVLDFLQEYLRRQIELGRLRPHDVTSSARAFIGMLIPQVAGRALFPALGKDGPQDEEHLRTVVGIFLRGLEERQR